MFGVMILLCDIILDISYHVECSEAHYFTNKSISK